MAYIVLYEKYGLAGSYPVATLAEANRVANLLRETGALKVTIQKIGVDNA